MTAIDQLRPDGISVHSTADGKDYFVTIEESEWYGTVVRFWDTKYADDPRFGPLGQRAGEYKFEEMLEHRYDAGLDMMFGQPYWKIDGRAMNLILDWLWLKADRDI